MLDIISFELNIPSFIESSYYISPGIVSAVFKVTWSIFSYLVILYLLEYGLAAAGLRELRKKDEKHSLWSFYQNYARVQGISSGRWGSMLLHWRSKRILVGLFFWAVLYAFEILFSLSIDNTYIEYYNGTNCVGRIENYNFDPFIMWDLSQNSRDTYPSNNSLIRQLINQRQVGNMVLLGDGMFAVSPADALYTKGQKINVSRAGLNCTTTPISYVLSFHGDLIAIYNTTNQRSGSITLPHFSNITLTDIGTITPNYVNIRTINSTLDTGPNGDPLFLVLLSNPFSIKANDINKKMFNTTLFLNECNLFYEEGYVTLLTDGHLNETSVTGQYTRVENQTLSTNFSNAPLSNYFSLSRTFLSLYDYPDLFIDRLYNKTYVDTLKIANDIVATYFLNGLDPYADICTFNQDAIPYYILVLGTRMSFGYIIIAVSFTIGALLISTVFTLIVFTKEERKQWALFSQDWSFASYIATGSQMTKSEFEKHAKDIHLKENDSKEAIENTENDEVYLENLLKK